MDELGAKREQCRCKDRVRAFTTGEFVPHLALGGWVFTSAPKRTMTPLARYYAAERGSENHTGEPFVWVHDCPFCGALLPPVAIDVIWRKITGDGDE